MLSQSKPQVRPSIELPDRDFWWSTLPMVFRRAHCYFAEVPVTNISCEWSDLDLEQQETIIDSMKSQAVLYASLIGVAPFEGEPH